MHLFMVMVCDRKSFEQTAQWAKNIVARTK